jgi:uncharacterized protein YndB with AHSA1/START domain
VSNLPSVVITKTIPLSAQAAFEAWLNPQALQRFMCPAPGSSVSGVEVEPRVGGSFLIVMHVAGQDLPHRGEYLAIERHRRLAFTWRSAMAGEGSQVTLTFDQLAPNQTRLTLEHTDLPDAKQQEAHREGWTHILSVLVDHASAP